MMELLLDHGIVPTASAVKAGGEHDGPTCSASRHARGAPDHGLPVTVECETWEQRTKSANSRSKIALMRDTGRNSAIGMVQVRKTLQ